MTQSGTVLTGPVEDSFMNTTRTAAADTVRILGKKGYESKKRTKKRREYVGVHFETRVHNRRFLAHGSPDVFGKIPLFVFWADGSPEVFGDMLTDRFLSQGAFDVFG